MFVRQVEDYVSIRGADGQTTRINVGCCGARINEFNENQIARIGTLDQVSALVVVGFELRDLQNNVRYRASVGEDGNPNIQLFDAHGNVVWSAP